MVGGASNSGRRGVTNLGGRMKKNAKELLKDRLAYLQTLVERSKELGRKIDETRAQIEKANAAD